jgi:hypothetical protein
MNNTAATIEAASPATVPQPEIPPPSPLVESRLDSPDQVGAGAFLGSMIGAAWLARANYKELGDDKKANQVMLAGVVLTFAVIGVAMFLPDNFPGMALAVPQVLAARAAAIKVFGANVAPHQPRGWGPTIGWSLLWLVVVLVVLVGALFVWAIVSPEAG